MRETKLRYITIFLSIIIILGLTITIIYKNAISNKNKLSTKIMQYIDNNYDKNDTCRIVMRDITDFKWDKMLIYQVGSSNAEISDLLQVDFKDSLDLVSGIIFVYNNKIVYKEQMLYNPERRDKLFLNIGSMYGQPEYGVFTPDDGIFEGSREKLYGSVYYTITPIK
ncbi:MAG: hypothetical protein K0S41_1863 [Anaerocolumna sp.]|jgi:hypothetical protein|nr:hypothetical protein [Anaerocolumna sp.]